MTPWMRPASRAPGGAIGASAENPLVLPIPRLILAAFTEHLEHPPAVEIAARLRAGPPVYTVQVMTSCRWGIALFTVPVQILSVDA